jgi:hypothetical protein
MSFYFDPNGHAHGFKRFSNGGFSPIAFPNATDTMPNAITTRVAAVEN